MTSTPRITPEFDPERDLRISRVIRAAPVAIWRAWTDPRAFETWWVPAPARCRVIDMQVRPGGALLTQYRDPDGEFGPHMDACFLDVVEHERLVFTTALVRGWRPARDPFITAIIDLAPHPEGTDYRAHVMHKDREQRDTHERLGFLDGWGAVIAQLAQLVEHPR